MVVALRIQPHGGVMRTSRCEVTPIERIAAWFRRMVVHTGSRSFGVGMFNHFLTAGQHEFTINQTSGMHDRY